MRASHLSSPSWKAKFTKGNLAFMKTIGMKQEKQKLCDRIFKKYYLIKFFQSESE